MATLLGVRLSLCLKPSCNKKLSLAVCRNPQHFSGENVATFQVKPYKLHKLGKGPSTSVQIKSEAALKLYESMYVIREMERIAASMYRKKLINGFCHLYIGQEAVGVGLASVLRPPDSAITSYRCHAIAYLMGGTAEGILGELFGRKIGVSRGKGGSMHIYGRNFYGGNGIVGVCGPLGAGVALASKYKGDGGVCFAMYGDGASNQGQLFESYNIAMLQKLPCIFVCENNIYGMGTSAKRSSATTEYYKRGDYIPGLWVDGMDVLAAREACQFAIDYCTSGKGPLVMEMETYRFMGHSMSDPGTSYRSRKEVEEVRKTRDPIKTFEKRLIDAKISTKEKLRAIKDKIKKDLEAATKRAQGDPPGLEELSSDIYVRNYHDTIRGVHPNAPLKHLEIAKR